MKKSFVLLLVGIAAIACLAAPAQARMVHGIYDKARAVPTKSGENVRITVYTKGLKRVKVTVDDSRTMKAIRFGTGCGKQRCDKWKVYAVRGKSECYDIGITGLTRRPGGSSYASGITACEPFPDGHV